MEDAVLNTRSRSVQVGALTFEFCQQTEDGSIYQDSLAARGDGINDLVFSVADLKNETSNLIERGAKVLLNDKSKGPEKFAYVDTREVGNLMIRLAQGQ